MLAVQVVALAERVGVAVVRLPLHARLTSPARGVGIPDVSCVDRAAATPKVGRLARLAP